MAFSYQSIPTNPNRNGNEHQNFNVRTITSLGAAILISLPASCAAGGSSEVSNPPVCSKVTNRAIFQETEYDVARLIWDGESRQKPVTRYQIATEDQQIFSLRNFEEYSEIPVGTLFCTKPYDSRQEYISNESALDKNGDICGKVTEAVIATEDGFAVSNFILDGAMERNLVSLPILKVDNVGDIAVTKQDYLFSPVGETVCVDSSTLK